MKLSLMWRFALLLTFALVGLSSCYATVGYDSAYDGDYPPAAYIATTEPYYLEGRPVYWYHDRWYYRDGGGWRHYQREPAELRARRLQGPVVRRDYEPGWRARAAAPQSAWRGRPAPSRGWRTR
jgi:hypothetical protein